MGLALRSGADVPETDFDQHLPSRYRWASETHWTPLAACRKAAEWLAPTRDAHVLDIGSGVGKLCVAASLISGARFTGVEQRPHLVEVAEELARRLDADGAHFICADAFTLEWREYGSLYFYNPFVEALFPEALRIDATVEHTEAQHDTAVALLGEKLTGMAAGTRVVIYHGLGCELPASYRRAQSEWVVHSTMELWIKEG